MPIGTEGSPDYAELVRRARELVPMLRARAQATETLRRLPDETIADLHAAGLFRLFQPARYGGCEAPLSAYVEIGAPLGQGCGSTSWVVNNLVAHNWMLGYWPEEAQDEVWAKTPQALIGSGFIFPAGHAQREGSGYRLTGRWAFSSGIDPSDWVMLAARVAAGAPDEAEEPRFFLLPKADCTIIDTWQVMGLAGTGSKDVEVKDAFVPAHRTLQAEFGKGGPHPGSTVNPAPLYRLPWYSLFSFVNAATALGIAQGAVADFIAATRTKLATYSGRHLADLATQQMRVAEAATLTDAAETLMLKDCAEAMAIAAGNNLPATEDKARWRRDGAFAAQMSGRAVDIIFAGAGGGAIAESHPLQRALRDVHAAQGHIGVNWDLNATMYGRVAFGLDPDFPLL